MSFRGNIRDLYRKIALNGVSHVKNGDFLLKGA